VEMESTVDHGTGRTRVQEESINKREMSETVCAMITTASETKLQGDLDDEGHLHARSFILSQSNRVSWGVV